MKSSPALHANPSAAAASAASAVPPPPAAPSPPENDGPMENQRPQDEQPSDEHAGMASETNKEDVEKAAAAGSAGKEHNDAEVPLLKKKEATDSDAEREQQQLLPLARDDLDLYKKDPYWRRLRIAALLGLVLLFLALVTVAVLIIVLDGECATDDAVQEGIALPSNGTTATPQMEYTDPLVHPLVRPKHLTVPQGESVRFHCEFPGLMRWRRVEADGQFSELPIGLEQSEDGLLQTVDNRAADVSHQGIYVCETVDHQGRLVHSEMVRLEVMPVPVEQPTTKEEEKGEEAEMPPTETTSSPAPPASSPISPLTSSTDEPSPSPLTPPTTTTTLTTTTTTTNSIPAKPGNRPRVDSYLLIASVGDPVHFRCWHCQFAWCQSGQRLLWRKMEPEIAQNLSVERDEKSAFLIFSSAQPADAGVYECLDLDTGTPSSAVHLQVEPARTPVIHPLRQTVPVNSALTFRCVVPGHADAQLSWRLENGVEANRLYGVNDDGRGTLQIEAARPDHERHGFVCWAVYPKRAQALHAGPAKIELVKKEGKEIVEEAKQPVNESNMGQQQQGGNAETGKAGESGKEVEEGRKKPAETEKQQAQQLQRDNDQNQNQQAGGEEGERHLDRAAELPETPLQKTFDEKEGGEEPADDEGNAEWTGPSRAEQVADEAVVQIEALLDNIAAMNTVESSANEDGGASEEGSGEEDGGGHPGAAGAGAAEKPLNGENNIHESTMGK